MEAFSVKDRKRWIADKRTVKPSSCRHLSNRFGIVQILTDVITTTERLMPATKLLALVWVVFQNSHVLSNSVFVMIPSRKRSAAQRDTQSGHFWTPLRGRGKNSANVTSYESSECNHAHSNPHPNRSVLLLLNQKKRVEHELCIYKRSQPEIAPLGRKKTHLASTGAKPRFKFLMTHGQSQRTHPETVVVDFI